MTVILLQLVGAAVFDLVFPTRLEVCDRRSLAITLIVVFDVMVSILTSSFYDHALFLLKIFVFKYTVKLMIIFAANEHLIPDDF
jgi:hypothetical protein